MKHVLGKSVGWPVWLALTAGARVALGDPAADNPYHAIEIRNAFNLHPPTVIQRDPYSPSQAQSKVKLTGLSTLAGVKQAYFSIAEPGSPGKPGARQKYCTLTEGQRNEGLEVLAIDLKGQNVKVRLQGEFMELPLEKARPSGGAPGGPAMPGSAAASPVPAAVPAAAVVPSPVNPRPPLGQATRPPRVEPLPDSDAQTVLIELERVRSEASVAQGATPPLPVTALSAEVAGTSTGE